MPVFHLTASPNEQGEFELSSEELKHWVKARRAKPGDTLELWLPNGKRTQSVLFQQGKRWGGKLIASIGKTETPLLQLHVGVGLIRWSRLEWLTEKLTELGVSELSLLRLKNSRYSAEAKISQAKIERLQRISQSALEQCERFTPLHINPPQTLKNWLERLRKNLETKWILLSRLESPPLTTPKLFTKNQASACLIGPEGGFTEEEVQLALSYDFKSIQLGQRILRTETAAVAIAAALNSYS